MRDVSSDDLQTAQVHVQHRDGRWGKVMACPHSLPGTVKVRLRQRSLPGGGILWGDYARWQRDNVVARATVRQP